MVERWVNVLVGLFVLAALMALVFLGFQASNMSGFKTGKSYELVAYFNDVSGLSKQASVTMAGVQVGRVKSIELNQERFQAKVVLEISNRYDALPVDTSADILTAGLLGENILVW
ncbi:MlaD family protein [Rappaport israeli]|uniref:MlaD family protein n=1 Tax=Rappaport israeli TaxID=1839807 RepID=UPI000A6CD670|nr:MlaD family protein [Rappaport israeli]